MTTQQIEPKEVAANMIALRGKQQATERCERYIAGKIRSENPTSFWQSVLAEIHAA
jgi:hypothetical protein